MAANSEPPSLQVAVASLGLAVIDRHVFLCADASKPKCADPQLGLATWEYLKNRLKELQLDRPGAIEPQAPHPLIFRTKANCLRLCQQGPIAVVYPDGVWYHSVTPEVMEQIIQQHLLGDRVVTEYLLTPAPVADVTNL